MRKDFGPKTWFFPLPVLLIGTYNEDGSPNLMNAAWGGIYDTNQVSICLDATHKTSINVKRLKEFSVTFADTEHMVEADYVGIVSGNKEPNKVEKLHLNISKSKIVNAPILEDFPMSLECKIAKMHEENNTLYLVADILNVSCPDNYLNSEGKFDTSKAHFISFNPVNNSYEELGSKVGNAFRDGLKLK